MRLLAATPFVAGAADTTDVPPLRVVSKYKPATVPGMPGRYPGVVVSVRSERAVDVEANKANDEVVREMMTRGMCGLTGDATPEDAWRRFFTPKDVVGIKVNCGGYPHAISEYAIVSEIVRRLISVGLPTSQLYVYERFQNQLTECNYTPFLPEGLQIVAAERANQYAENSGYDPFTYVETNFFGEEDTRSNIMRLITQRLTKIINIPNMKDHRASGVTGCLKNIAYGSFSNVARTHMRGRSHTYSMIGDLASVEPLRSRTVLQIMDGLRGVWHGGPFARTRRYLFFPKQILFGTDPVAIDRLLIDVIEKKRLAEGALSLWDRTTERLKLDAATQTNQAPDLNVIIREPGHVEYASKRGLGVYDLAKIKVREIDV